MSTSHDASAPRTPRWLSIIMQLVAMLVVMGLLLLVPAGTIAWTRGWLFLLVFAVLMGAAALYVWRVNPEIFAARSRIHEGTKLWDRILLTFLLPGMLAILPVAALDDGRFHWSLMSWWFVGLGYLLFIAGVVIAAWAQGVNRFFEPGVRIQTDRGHHVVDSGPYAIVRHPGYVAACLLFAGLTLSLGSWWALVPAGFAILLLAIRTAWEDRTLQSELPGYTEYAQRVHTRLIPGVW
jgi:protein-S-isoprenylcysteine O-methyltransferase Ste14